MLTESIRESLTQTLTPDFIVLPECNRGTVEKRRLREDFGLVVIEYCERDRHAELLDLIDHIEKLSQPSRREKIVA